MAQDSTKKEALFNEVKGSLFEYLVAKEIAVKASDEIGFQQSFDKNYLTVLSQQDRMVRQFYPEMLPFLAEASRMTAEKITQYLKQKPLSSRVVGKFSNSDLRSELFEADLILKLNDGSLPVSLKLNKKNAFVNTKSGGIKSFFSQYFPFIDPSVQQRFNQLVDMEFNRMAIELHALHDIDYPGDFSSWVKRGLSELPGELDPDSRLILKNYYARIAREMFDIFEKALKENRTAFLEGLPALMGFGSRDILQVIFFHDFPGGIAHDIDIHSFKDVSDSLAGTRLKSFGDISSVEFEIGNWALQVRVKPMNKFTTTAIKINCSVKVTPPSAS